MPGFRSRARWKMALATAGYLCGALFVLIIGSAAWDTAAPGAHRPSTTPAVRVAHTRADFRHFVGQVTGIEAVCADANKTAGTSVGAATKGGGDEVQAYQDAQAANSACLAAMSDADGLSVPDSLTRYKLDNVPGLLSAWASDWATVWDDAEKILQNPSDIAAAADLKTATQDASDQDAAMAVALAQASLTLKVDLKGIASIAPIH